MNNFTPAQLQKARIYAASIDRGIAAHALDPDFGFASHVTHTDKLKCIARHIASAEAIESGSQDHNFTVWQRMTYFLTGECVALFAEAAPRELKIEGYLSLREPLPSILGDKADHNV